MKKGLGVVAKGGGDHLTPEFDNEWIKDNRLILYYDEFLRGSRHALSNQPHKKRLALIVCLVVVCNEQLQWRLFSAVKLIRSWMNLLDEWIQSSTDAIEDKIIQQFGNL